MADKESILIVDDDESICKTLSLILSKKGYETETAGTGREAIEKAQERFFNLALIDIKLPDMEGVELLTPLKKMHPDMAVLMVTAYASVESAIQALKDGTSAYITKPLNMDEVLSTVREIFEKQRLLREKRHAEELLQESVKELTCLYAINHDMRKQLSLEGLCRRIVKHLVPAMRLPEITIPVIELDNRRFTSKKYTKDLSHGLHAEIRVGGETCGHLCVYYSEDKTFLIPEEQNLINAIAEDLSLWLERKQAEERYRDLIEWEKDIIYALDEKGNITFASPAVETMLGYRPEEVVGKNFMVLVPGELQEKTLSDFHKLLRTGGITAETALLDKKGQPHFVEYSSTTIEEGDKVVGTRGIARNITERKKSEQKLKESEEKYRTLVESSTDAILMLDKERNVVTCNQAFLNLFGYKKREMEGKSIRMIHQSDESFHSFGQITYPAIEKAGFFRTEWEFMHKDGTIVPVETTTSAIRSPDGSITGYNAIIRDITERKEAEEEHRKLESRLAQAQRMEAIGTLAGGIAHSFNNLLMGIMGNASLTLLDIDTTHPHYENLKGIEKQVQSGAKITKQLLGYARKGKYEVKPISLNQVVKETADTFDMTRKEMRIDRELAEDLFGIEADQEQIEQVIWNLFVNAADAMPSGGDLFVKTMNVTEKAMRGKPYKPKPGDYVLLTVRDTGVGMDRKTMERIFDPFFTTKDMGRGTGLGLASAYGIIKAHGGYVYVNSKKGQGTTFEIYLPAPERKVQEALESSEHIIEGTGTILLVDDEAVVLDVGCKMLKMLGYTVFESEGGREAVRIYQEKKDTIDMVILDMIMPDMGGGEAYDRMKEINPKVKVLLSSGYSIDGQATEIMDRGCDGFIQKPFSIKKLSREIRELLDKK